ncbi:MAG: C4-type zinc ribbon domain-containing protein [Ilumatobacteraceae bacterium]
MNGSDDPGGRSVHERLLELQDVDTAIDQLAHRRARLPELEAAELARAELLEWEAAQARLRARLDELGAEIESAESASAEIDRQRSRLDGQMKTVIAPREAEALQHEIATLQERREELDDRELAALEEQASLDDTLVAHAAREESLRANTEAADQTLAAVQADLDGEAAELDARRVPLRDDLDEVTLARYDELRAHLGVAVARLVGHRCEGCHLDLSPAEVDEIKATPADAFATCPQCGRILVR